MTPSATPLPTIGYATLSPEELPAQATQIPQVTGATTTTTLAPRKGGTLTFGTFSELSEFDPAATARGSSSRRMAE